MSTFNDRLELLLYEHRMNRSQLARKVGVSVSTVHRWYARGSVPGLETVSQIADIFDVDIKWLLGEQEERKLVASVPEVIVEEDTKKEDELDDELVRLIKGLTPAQIQRVRDFLSGLRG